MPYAQLHIREIAAQNLPAHATTLFRRRPKTRNIICKAILQRRRQPIILQPSSVSLRSVGDDGLYIMKDGSPVYSNVNDDVIKTSEVEEGTLCPVFRVPDPRPAQETNMIFSTPSSASSGADDEVERGPSEATGGGKRRSLNFFLGPAPSLFSYDLELHDIFYARLRIEFWDSNIDELLSFTVMKMRDIFEMDFGINEFSESRELQQSDIVPQSDAESESSMCSPNCFICLKWLSSLPALTADSRGATPLPSPSGPGKTYFENGPGKDGAKFGSMRVTARIYCSDFVIDLLKQPEINLVTVGFQIFLRIIQFSDPMELSRVPRPDIDANSVDSQGSPSALCRILQTDCLRALFDAPVRFKSESVSMYRQLIHRLWAILDSGATRFGLLFIKMLVPFGSYLSAMTDLEIVTPNINLSITELICRLDPGPRVDALSTDNLAAVTNLVRLIDQDNPKSALIAEAMTIRALQLLTTFAVQADLPFTWRLRYLKHLAGNDIEPILAYYLQAHQDSELGVDALDLCMALTSMVDEIVETHLTTMPSAASQKTKLASDENKQQSDKWRKSAIRQSLSENVLSVHINTLPPLLALRTHIPAVQEIGVSSIQITVDQEFETAKSSLDSSLNSCSHPAPLMLSPNQRKQLIIKADSEETLLTGERRRKSTATWSIIGSQKATDQETREVLKAMEARSLANGSENARLIQRILFAAEFGLERLPMKLISCNGAGGKFGMGSFLYPMQNMLDERGPPARTATGHTGNVHCVLGMEESFALTHVVVAVGDIHRRHKNDVASIAVYVTEQPVSDLPPLSYQQLRVISGYFDEQCPKLPETDPPAKSPVFVADLRPHRFVEIILPKPVRGRYVTVTLNPSSPTESTNTDSNHISIDHVDFIGWALASENNKAKARRSHLELIGNVAYHVGISVPLDGGDLIQLEDRSKKNNT